MNEISTLQRLFFGLVGIQALFVAYLGIVVPARMQRSFTWVVLPPLHARFVGVLYLFGGVYMIGCILARRWSQISPAPAVIGIFTSLLLLVTLLNLDAFNFDLTPVWVWTLAYIYLPAIAFTLAWVARDRKSSVLHGPALPTWATVFLRVQAGLGTILGVVLLVAPDAMVDIWPWKITAGLAQFYGGPFLAYAVASWLYSRRQSWGELVAIVPAMLVFTGGTVVVSLVHNGLFSTSDLATWVWFAGYGTGAIVLAAMSVRAVGAALADRRKAAQPVS